MSTPIPIMSSSAHACLGCDALFGMWKQLSAHISQCMHYHELTDQIFDCKCKSLKRHIRDKKRVCPMLTVDAGPSSLNEHPTIFDQAPVEFEQGEAGDMDDEPQNPVSAPFPQVTSHSTDLPHMPLSTHQQRSHLPKEPNIPPPPSPLASSNSLCRSDEASQPEPFISEPDSFGLYCMYVNQPTFIPIKSLATACDAPTLDTGDRSRVMLPQSVMGLGEGANPTSGDIFAPFTNPTCGLLMAWQYSGTNQKSAAELNWLAQIQTDPLFNTKELAGFSHTHEMKLLNKFLRTKDNLFHEEHGWKPSSVSFHLPKEKARFTSADSAPLITIDGIYHHDLTDVIMSAFKDPEFGTTLHMTPFTQHWKTADNCTIDVLLESFRSPEMLDTYKEINALPREPGDDLECVVASLMVWSDSMHLASFSDASMWPFYLFFANQSEYTQCKPSVQACHHIAYIPTLPDNFQETYMSHFGEPMTSETFMHCKRELYQGVWHLLLDERFMHAYQYGLMVACADGMAWRVFPHFFSYSVDYPEKVLIARIKFLGTCPCPRCLIKKTDLHKMGMAHDMRHRIKKIRVDDCDRHCHIAAVCRLIFEKGISVDSEQVKALLNEFSYVPTHNAFSDRLFQFGFNYFKMLLVDLLHEFELGVWKAIFMHLICILYAAGGQGIQELNKCYCAVPPFRRGTIHKFNWNTSAMKRLAARDFEDLLQCAIPMFESLLPELHNGCILDLLFDLAVWHAYAKLRLHTSDTLAFFDTATLTLAHSETMTHGHWKPAFVAPSSHGEAKEASTSHSMAKQRLLNLRTYKYHALGDYPNMIHHFGMTDNYTTQTLDQPRFEASKDETFNAEYPGDYMGGNVWDVADLDVDEGDGLMGSDVDSDSDDKDGDDQGDDNEANEEFVADDSAEELDDAIYIEEGYGAP
ncbi:hypothetical protein EDD16DRAFT_1708409 [Pisolithus croceorrhizus]|nr:hypothetical protein EDD16DRAFT_1708409 [Pisolithus croceorrhizus]